MVLASILGSPAEAKQALLSPCRVFGGEGAHLVELGDLRGVELHIAGRQVVLELLLVSRAKDDRRDVSGAPDPFFSSSLDCRITERSIFL